MDLRVPWRVLEAKLVGLDDDGCGGTEKWRRKGNSQASSMNPLCSTVVPFLFAGDSLGGAGWMRSDLDMLHLRGLSKEVDSCQILELLREVNLEVLKP